MFQILVVEDDENTGKLMQAILSHAGYDSFLAGDGIEALEIIDKQHIDLVVLDVMMPKMDGYEFTETMRQGNNNTPILMVSAKHLPIDKIRGFVSGTDDYMVKPVDENEMILRIKALLRRSQIMSEHKLQVAGSVLDYDALSVTKNGVTVSLPKKEFYILYKLLSYPNKIFTRLQLMDEIWGMDTNSTAKTVDVHINRLRKRFENCDDFEIIAVRGVGYKAVIKQ